MCEWLRVCGRVGVFVCLCACLCVGNTMVRGADGPSSFSLSLVSLTSPSFDRRRCRLNYMYSVMDTIRFCLAVKYDFCDNLQSYCVL